VRLELFGQSHQRDRSLGMGVFGSDAGLVGGLGIGAELLEAGIRLSAELIVGGFDSIGIGLRAVRTGPFPVPARLSQPRPNPIRGPAFDPEKQSYQG
jgi:hypothetical protein